MTESTNLVERVTYRDGQRLTARDLTDDRRRNGLLRRLHVRHLHETWGIATGFDVASGGPSAVAVGPGYALDTHARNLVLSASVALPVPEMKGPQLFVLVATFLDDCSFPNSVADAAVCLNAPLHPRRERPAFAWRTPPELEIGPMVPLCSLTVENGAIKGAIETRVRRYARRLVRPHIASGRSDTGFTLWQKWWQLGSLMGWAQQVDTSEAGFTATPQYFAQLVPVKPSPHPIAQVMTALASSHGHIKEASRDGFVFQAVVHENSVRDLLDTWAVSWIGVQPMAGCPPALNLKRLLTLAGHFFTFKFQ